MNVHTISYKRIIQFFACLFFQACLQTSCFAAIADSATNRATQQAKTRLDLNYSLAVKYAPHKNHMAACDADMLTPAINYAFLRDEKTGTKKYYLNIMVSALHLTPEDFFAWSQSFLLEELFSPLSKKTYPAESQDEELLNTVEILNILIDAHEEHLSAHRKFEFAPEKILFDPSFLKTKRIQIAHYTGQVARKALCLKILESFLTHNISTLSNVWQMVNGNQRVTPLEAITKLHRETKKSVTASTEMAMQRLLVLQKSILQTRTDHEHEDKNDLLNYLQKSLDLLQGRIPSIFEVPVTQIEQNADYSRYQSLSEVASKLFQEHPSDEEEKEEEKQTAEPVAAKQSGFKRSPRHASGLDLLEEKDPSSESN